MIRISRRERSILRRLMPSAFVLLAACESASTPPRDVAVEPTVAQSAVRFRKEYVLAPGDQVEVVVRRVPEASRTVAIRPDGRVSLPLIDDVQASGLTPSELDRLLTERFSSRLLDPDVTVIPTVVRQPVVYVTGEVTNNAAVVPLRDAPTAIQAIAFAGGFRRSAATRHVAIIRLAEDGHLIAMSAAPGERGQSAPVVALRQIVLQPDDIVFVPENGRSQVARILDDFVNRPLAGINAAVGTYVNFQLIDRLNE